MTEKVIPWLERVSKEHETLRFWTTFMLVDIPAYLAIRFGVRTSDFKLRNAGIRQFSLFFAGTGKNRYQRLALNYLTQIARMPDKDMEVLGKVLTATWEEREFASLALDEIMEMFNRVIKQSLTKVSQAYMVKLAPIVEH